MSAHTPGKWMIYWGREGTYPLGVHNGDRNIITGFGRPASPEGPANARLIAAAPDLLDVVKRGRQKLATYNSVYPGDKELRGLLEAWDAAIAKATGGERG